jgi:hypothetical protein
MAHGPHQIAALVLGKCGMMAAFEKPDIGVAADGDIEVAVGGGLFEETDVAGVEPVEASCDDDFFAGRRLGVLPGGS